MGKCCILYCKSPSSKECIMKSFPKNENLKDLWIKSINRPDWTPHPKSIICELHFTPDMWETVNNKKTLKPDAVPTIFQSPPERRRFPGKIFIGPRERMNMKLCGVSSQISRGTSILKNSTNPTNQSSTQFVKSNQIPYGTSILKNPTNSTIIKTRTNENEAVCDVSSQISHGTSILKNSENSTNSPSNELECDVENQEQIQHENNENENCTMTEKKNILYSVFENKKDIEKLFCKQEQKIRNLQDRIQRVKNEKLKLVCEQHNTYKAVLLTLFTEDQISYLIKKQGVEGNSKCQWSDTTIKKALRLKLVCGNSGYDELLKQGFPLPSRRTLDRRIEQMKLQPEMLDETLNYSEPEVAKSDDCSGECSVATDQVNTLEEEIIYN